MAKIKNQAGVNRMELISSRAKTLYNGGKGKVKVWTKAIAKASAELKKEGKI